jgi:hypothetical protein
LNHQVPILTHNQKPRGALCQQASRDDSRRWLKDCAPASGKTKSTSSVLVLAV